MADSDVPMMSLAVTLQELPAQLGEIFYFVVLPVLLLATIGWALQRRLGLDMPTLTRLNFHFVVPGMIYFMVVSSPVSAADVGTVMGFAAAVMAGQMALTYVAAIVRRVPKDQRSALMMSTIFNNSGNYGLPLQEMAFRPLGAAFQARAANLQVFYMLFQNIGNFTLGVLLAARGHRRATWGETVGHVLRFPPLWALAAAILTVLLRSRLTPDEVSETVEALQPFVDVLAYVKGAFIALAVCTLGAQLATVKREGPKYPVTLSVVLRLLTGPALGLGVIYLFGLEGLTAQVLLIGTSTPTAVNCMLLCLEFDNHPDFAARAVFYSTVLSPVTVTLTVFLARSGLLPGFAL